MCFYKDLLFVSEVILPFVIFLLCLYTNPSPTSILLTTEIDGSSKELHEYTTSKRRRFPDVIVAGCMKTGTSFLRTTLAMHSRIAITRETEVNFFDRMDRLGFHWYLDQLPPVEDGELVLEKSPNYYMNRRIPFYASKDFLTINQTVNSKHKLIHYSTYSRFLPSWLAYFKLGSSLHIVDADNLIRRPWEELVKIQEFLGLEVEIDRSSFVFSKLKGFYCYTRMGNFAGNCARNCHNRQLTWDRFEDGSTCMTKGHDQSNITSEEFLDRLYDFYQPHNEKLFRILGQTFEWSKIKGPSYPVENIMLLCSIINAEQY